jgi:hypothetical protein
MRSEIDFLPRIAEEICGEISQNQGVFSVVVLWKLKVVEIGGSIRHTTDQNLGQSLRPFDSLKYASEQCRSPISHHGRGQSESSNPR